MTDFSKLLSTVKNNRFAKFGVPFLVLVVGGSFGLQQFTRLRFEYKQPKLLDPRELEKYGIQMKKPGEVTLESEYEKLKELDIDNWQNIRGPRPWEEDTLAQLPSSKKQQNQ